MYADVNLHVITLCYNVEFRTICEVYTCNFYILAIFPRMINECQVTN